MTTGIAVVLGFSNIGFANDDRSIEHLAVSGRSQSGSRNVEINDVRLTDDHINHMERKYKLHIPDGVYWYDRNCGAWGMKGGPTKGFALAGLDLGGPLKEKASNGNTGVFVNGRQLHWQDVLGLRQLLGTVWPGRFWVDAWGNYGFEGGMYLGNLWVIVRQRMAAGVRDGGPWAVYGGRNAGGGLVCGDGQGNNYAQFPGGIVY